MKDKRVGVLLGGLGSEREISLRSGEAIARALTDRGYDVQRVYVDRDLDRVLRQSPIDVAFLALHGPFGEDGCVQGMLELLGIPYTGSGVLASALAMDKLKSKELFRLYNVPTPPYYAADASRLDALEEVHGSFGFPVFVKPRRAGSSVGAGRASDLAEPLAVGLEEVHRTVEVLQLERVRALDANVLTEPLLVAVQLRARRKCAVGDHREDRALGTEAELPRLSALSDDRVEPQPPPQALDREHAAVRPCVDQTPARRVGDDLLGGAPAQDAVRELAKSFGYRGVLDAAEVVDDLRAAPLLLPVPHALGELVVLDDRAVPEPLLRDAEVHVPMIYKILGSEVKPCG